VSTKVTGWVWDQDLLIQRKAVLLWLAERATDNGVCFPGQAEIRQKTGLSESMVRRHLHWLASDGTDDGEPRRPLLRIVERPVTRDRHTSNVYVIRVPWALAVDVVRELGEVKHMPAAALKGVGRTGAPQGDGWHGCTPVGSTGAPQVAGTGAREEPSLPDRHRNHTPLPPTSAQQHRVSVTTTELYSVGAQDAISERDLAIEADRLVEALYRGLGVGIGGLTRSILARERSIALQLVAAGATSAEAEAYAHEMASVPNRLAPIDLRSFERERSTWTARQGRAAASSRRYVDRTGQGIDDTIQETNVATPESLGPPEPSRASTVPSPPERTPSSSQERPVGNVGSPADWTAALRHRLEGGRS
jgi:hypothetical protein